MQVKIKLLRLLKIAKVDLCVESNIKYIYKIGVISIIKLLQNEKHYLILISDICTVMIFVSLF